MQKCGRGFLYPCLKFKRLLCNHILNGEKPILFVSHDEDDGMWQFLCGGSHGMEDAKVAALGEVFDLDPSIGKVAEMPCGYCATRDKVDSDWVVKNVDGQ